LAEVTVFSKVANARKCRYGHLKTVNVFFFSGVAHWDNQLLTAGGRGEATEGKGTVVRANSRPQTNI